MKRRKVKTRIVKRTYINGRILFVIQQKHYIFRWKWVDAWVNSSDGEHCIDYFNTLKEAKENLHHFTGEAKHVDEIVEEY